LGKRDREFDNKKSTGRFGGDNLTANRTTCEGIRIPRCEKGLRFKDPKRVRGGEKVFSC